MQVKGLECTTFNAYQASILHRSDFVQQNAANTKTNIYFNVV
jgi:hypothetical protein